MFILLVSLHCITEEMVIYPLFTRCYDIDTFVDALLNHRQIFREIRQLGVYYKEHGATEGFDEQLKEIQEVFTFTLSEAET